METIISKLLQNKRRLLTHETSFGRCLSVIRALQERGVERTLMSHETKLIDGVREIRFTIKPAT